MKPKGFTLVEVLIVTIVIGILAVVLLRAYTFISEISFRIAQEKNVTQEILFISQTMQNLSDRNSIDYEMYKTIFNQTGYLIAKNGFTDILYLSGQDGIISIYSTGQCIQPGEEINYITGGMECYLEITKNNGLSQISNPKMIYLSKVIFKIIPYDSSSNYLNGVCSNYTSCIHKPGFFLIAKSYSPTYSQIRYNKIQIPIQQFFNSISLYE